MKTLTDFSKNKKGRAYLLAFLFFIIFSCFTLFFLSRDSRSFRNFCDDFFVSELTANTLNMHYTIAHPADFGIDYYEPVLPSYSKERKNSSLRELAATIQTLCSLDTDRLTETDAYTYRLLLPYLQNKQEGMNLYFYSNPLSPSSGMQSQLPILFAEYTFRNKQDIEDYLSLLDQTDSYFQGILDFLNTQAKAGLFMPDYSVDKVIQQCDTIMDASLLKSNTHFLNTTFEERLDSLLVKKLITPEEKEAYLSENSRLLNTVMLPAYQNLGDGLLLLKGSGKNENGLCHYPDGREYYLYLLHSNTGSYRDIGDIKQLLFIDFDNNFEALYSLLRENPGLASVSESSSESFSCKRPEEMLKSLQQMMDKDFPALLEVTDDAMPVCTVKSISKSLQEYCSPAFYLTPPLDDIHENVIYINQKNNPAGVELYTTLAHEGYPGHLYQTVYSQLYFGKANINPIRSLLSYGGYVEGWAMYVEIKSYDYAKNLMRNDFPQADALYETYKLDRQIQLCLYSLLDIAIHYEGASYEQVHKMLGSIGISSPTTTRSIYEYIVEEPTTYLKYYLGYLEILELKKEAERLWGKSYSEYLFHKFYLENGPADFSNLQNQLQQMKLSAATT